MAQNTIATFTSKYENIQSDSSIQDFYKRLCAMTYDALSTSGKHKALVSKWWNSWKITSATLEGLGTDKAVLNYRDEFFKVLSDLRHHDEKVVLFLDEFPDVVWNIYKHNSVQDAETLLNDVRTLRHSKEFKDVFVMVLLGSVGLSHIVKKVSGRVDKVNDLHQEHLKALKPIQALEFLDHLVKDASMQLDLETKTYLLKKIGHFIPYYIQLIIEECDDLLYDELRPNLTTLDIDKAYNSLLKKSQHFTDWDDRLSKYFSDKYGYLITILSECAHNDGLDLQELYNIAVAHGNTQEWKADIDDILIADGYLTEDDAKYTFNSPILRDWWKSRHPKIKQL